MEVKKMGHGDQTQIGKISLDERIQLLDGYYVASGIAVPQQLVKQDGEKLGFGIRIDPYFALNKNRQAGTNQVLFQGENYLVTVGQQISIGVERYSPIESVEMADQVKS